MRVHTVTKVTMADMGGVLDLFRNALPFCEAETFNSMRKSLYALCGRGQLPSIKPTTLEYVFVAQSADKICAVLFLTYDGHATLLVQQGVYMTELNKKIRSLLRKDRVLVHKFSRILCEAV